MTYILGSLFSGIGGLELGLERAGLGPTLFQCEIDPYNRAVLAKHWPHAARYDDVRTLSGSTLPAVDVLCGGFPCQGLSQANPGGSGLADARSGLWFEYRRLVEEIRPRAVVVENVSRLIRRGLDVVATGLVDLGYRVEFARIQAAAVGAPHIRERLFIIAVANAEREHVRLEPGRGSGESGRGEARARDAGEVADAESQRRHAGSGGVGDGAGRTFPGDSGEVANADVRRREGIGLEEHSRIGSALRDVADGRDEGGWRDGTAVGVAHRERLEVQEHVGEPDEQSAPARGVRDGDGSVESGVGGDVARAPRGLDGDHVGGSGRDQERFAQEIQREARETEGRAGIWGPGPGGAWPAGRGEAQHPWEPPRTKAGVKARPARLRAIGNAVSPQVAYVVGCRVQELLTPRG